MMRSPQASEKRRVPFGMPGIRNHGSIADAPSQFADAVLPKSGPGNQNASPVYDRRGILNLQETAPCRHAFGESLE